jgi:site-specific recombinase XerD
MAPNNFPYCSTDIVEMLNHRQLEMVNEDLKAYTEWMNQRGKNPELNLGLDQDTADNNRARVDQFLRRFWEDTDQFTLRVTHDDAEAYIQGMREGAITKTNGESYAGGTIRKTVDALKQYFLWQKHEHGGKEWTPGYSINEETVAKFDPFNKEELELLRTTSLSYDTLPSYKSVSPNERDRLKAHLAQRLGKPKAKVTPADWKEHNRKWKIPSLIHTAADTGIEPCEVEVIKVEWYDSEQGVLRIPKDQSSKERVMWDLALSKRTQKSLDRWLPQRDSLSKYDGRDELWLTREGTPYQSHSLNRLLDNLMDEADISQEGRRLSWMSIRHSVATYFANEGSVAEAQAQLRHQSPTTTMRYTHPTPEERRDTLENL